MEKNLSYKLIIAVLVTALLVVFSGSIFAAEPAKTGNGDDKTPDAGQEANINQIAFIVKFDKNEDGKVDNTEFTGSHFKNMDKNGDGFIEPHEAPEGKTAY